MPYFRSTTKKTQVHTKNRPVYGMKYPGLINSFSHRITNYRSISRRSNDTYGDNKAQNTIKVPEWIKRQILVDISASDDDYFGNSLAMTDDGMTFVAGIFGDDEIYTDQGSLFVFELSGGSYIHKEKLVDLNPDTGDQLGTSVDITGDGKYIIGGVVNDNETVLNQGSIVVFKHLDNSYIFRQKLVDVLDASFNDNLGHSVAISSDGKYIVGSAINDTVVNEEQGSIIVFELSGTQFEYKQKLTDPSGENLDNLGQSVAISSLTSNNNYYIVAGSSNDDEPNTDQGSISVFELSGSEFVYKQKLIDVDGSNNDNFGYSVAVSSDGKYIVGSSLNDDGTVINQGSILVFEFNGSEYVFKQKLTHPNASANDQMGSSLTISSNGQYIVAGVSNKNKSGDETVTNTGAMVVFELVNNSFVYRKTLVNEDAVENDKLGTSVAVSNDGNYIIGGSVNTLNNNQGSVTVFTKK